MSATAQSFGLNEIQGYQFNAAQPCDFDPEYEGSSWKKPPLGTYRFRLVGRDTKVELNKPQNWDG